MLSDWLRTLLVSGCTCSLLLYICPDGKIRGLMESGCACVMLLALLSPLKELSFDEYAASVTAFRQNVMQQESFGTEKTAELTKQIIEQEYSAYILTEAEKQEIELTTVKVTAQQNEEGMWLPYEVIYTSTEVVPETFREHISTQFGIPEERQNTYEVSGTTQ